MAAVPTHPEIPSPSRAALLRRLIAADDLADSIPAHEPRPAFPGSAEKIDRMTERVGRHESPFQPGDATFDDAARMGYKCSTDENGALQWRRPVGELERRELLCNALEALRAARRGKEAGGEG